MLSSDDPVPFVVSFFQENFKVKSCIFSNFFISKCPSRVAMYKSTSLERGESTFLTTLLTASVVDERNTRMEHCWNESDRGDPKYPGAGIDLSTIFFFTINPTRTFIEIECGNL